MANLYKILLELCEKKGITGYRMCKDLNIQPSIMTDLKMGRRSSVKMETANKIASYFGVSVSYLLGAEQLHVDGSFSDSNGYGGSPAPATEKSPVYDDEALALMEEMHKRPELKALFSTSKRASKEDIEAVDQLLKRMARGDAYED